MSRAYTSTNFEAVTCMGLPGPAELEHFFRRLDEDSEKVSPSGDQSMTTSLSVGTVLDRPFRTDSGREKTVIEIPVPLTAGKGHTFGDIADHIFLLFQISQILARRIHHLVALEQSNLLWPFVIICDHFERTPYYFPSGLIQGADTYQAQTTDHLLEDEPGITLGTVDQIHLLLRVPKSSSIASISLYVSCVHHEPVKQDSHGCMIS